MTKMLRTWRNRLLRLKLIKTDDIERAMSSRWTWGSDGVETEHFEAWISILSLLHDAAEMFGFYLSLYLDDDPGTVPADDPRWYTEARLKLERIER